MDNAEYVTVLLMDKGYYDYDYKKPESAKTIATYDDTVKSDEELRNILGRFGWGQDDKPMTAEEMQRIAMEEEKQKQQNHKL